MVNQNPSMRLLKAELKIQESIVLNNKIQVSNRFAQKMVKTNLSILESRILIYILGLVKPARYTDGINELEYLFDVDEFCEKAGYKKGVRNRKRIEEALVHMAEEKTWEKEGDFIFIGNYFQSVCESEIKNVYVVALDEKLEDELFDLKSYVSFEESIAYRFAKKYSLILYLLCKSWKTARKFSITISELMFLLNITGKHDSHHLKRDVLYPAIEEINKVSDLFISLEDKKVDRKTTGSFLIRVSAKGTENSDFTLEAVMKKYQLTEEDVIHLIEEHENKNEVQIENDLYKLFSFPNMKSGRKQDSEINTNELGMGLMGLEINEEMTEEDEFPF